MRNGVDFVDAKKNSKKVWRSIKMKRKGTDMRKYKINFI